MKNTGQVMKVEMESLKKTPTEVKMEVKILGTQTGTTGSGFTNIM